MMSIEFSNKISQYLVNAIMLLVCCLNLSVSFLFADGHTDLLIPPGQSLIQGDLFQAFTIYNAGGLEASNLQIIDINDVHYHKAFKLTTPQKTNQPWNYSINFYNAFPVNKGDFVFASFVVRAEPNHTGESKGHVKAMMMEPMPSYAPLASLELEVDNNFRQGRIAFKADHDYQPAEIQLSIQYGYDPQTIEIADIKFIKCNQDIEIADLAVSANTIIYKRQKKETNQTYEGRDKNAPWRKEAWKRIEKIRKADIIVIVQDQNGKPIKNATVHVAQQRHKFWFGNENRALLLADKEYIKNRNISAYDIEQYQQKFKELFNITAFGNDLVYNYWYAYGKEKAPEVYEKFLKPNDIALRGIPLIWAGRQTWKNPKELFELSKDDLRERLITHMTEIMTAFKGQAVMWDVLNEPISEPEFLDILGRDEAVKWYKLTKELAPNAKLYCNDYGLLFDRGKLIKFIELIKYLLANGAPIDGVSPQSHLWANQQLPSMETLKENFDMLAELGLEIYPDQFEVIVPDEQLHSDYTRDFYIMSFSHPAVVGITHWGLWEGDIWMKDAAWYRKDWSEKPFAKVYKDLVFNKWWTDTKGKSDKQGRFQVRGFLGTYAITVTKDDQVRNLKFDLDKEDKTLKVDF